MKQALLVVICLFAHQVIIAQPESEPTPQKKLKILSWNIYMLPRLVSAKTGKADRAHAIGELLAKSDYDVVFFQEAFHPRARKIILKELNKAFQYQAGPANQKTFSLKTNSGLWIFSKYPIIHSKSIIYKTRHGIDAFSRKGGLLVELDMNGQRVQVAGTHLQNCGPFWLKKMQCVEFYERLLKPFAREGVTQIVCGDFNINRNLDNDGYESMLRLLGASDTNKDPSLFTYDRIGNDLRNEPGNQQDIIDYILVRKNGREVKWSNKVTRLRKIWNRTASDLSDHYSIEANIIFPDATESSMASISTRN